MAKRDEAPRRLEQVATEPAERSHFALLKELAHRVPSPLRGVAAIVAGLYTASALGVRIPGQAYLRSVFNEPIVFFFVAALAVVVVVAFMAIGLWFALSVFAYIRNHLWIRRPAGFEPQAIRRGASELEQSKAEIDRLLDKSREREATLTAALARTNQRVAELEVENARLRARADGGQLSLDDE